jgi:hypothetical protein
VGTPPTALELACEEDIKFTAEQAVLQSWLQMLEATSLNPRTCGVEFLQMCKIKSPTSLN